MKTKEILIKLNFLALLGLTIIGAMFKICHWNGASEIISIGLLASISFVILSVSEVSNSKVISNNEKTMWISGLIMISPIVGFIYIFSGRKRILKTKKS